MRVAWVFVLIAVCVVSVSPQSIPSGSPPVSSGGQIRVSTDKASNNTFTQGYLGIEVADLNQDLAQLFSVPDVSGSLVIYVQPGSGAETAGILRGDVLRTFNGQPVQNSASAFGYIRATDAGAAVELGIQRDGTLIMIPAKLDHAPPPSAIAEMEGDNPALVFRARNGTSISIVYSRLNNGEPALRFPVMHVHGFGYCRGYLYINSIRVVYWPALDPQYSNDGIDSPRKEVGNLSWNYAIHLTIGDRGRNWDFTPLWSEPAASQRVANQREPMTNLEKQDAKRLAKAEQKAAENEAAQFTSELADWFKLATQDFSSARTKFLARTANVSPGEAEMLAFTKLEHAGKVAEKAGNMAEALQRYAAALNVLPLRAPIQLKQPMQQHAAQLWRRIGAKVEMPEEANRHRILAEAAYQEKDFARAIQQYESALNAYPTWPAGQFNIALLCGETGNYQCAIQHMSYYLDLVPEAPDVQVAKEKLIVWEDKLDRGATQ